MEKFNLGKCRYHFWFVIFFSLVFWFYLFYFNSPALISIKNKVRSLQNDYWYSVVSRKSSSLLVVENSVETISQPPGGVEPINPVAVTEDGVDHLVRNNVTEPINQLDFTVKGTGSFNRLIDMQRRKETGEESIAKPPINQVSPAENGSKPVNRPAFTEEGDESIKERRKAVVENRAELVNVPSPVENRVEAINQSFATENQGKPNSDPCSGRYVYVHKLPSRFNDDLIKDCRILNLWIDMCRFTSNMGLGPPIFDSHGVFSSTGWYNTNQFTLGVIFNHRMKHYQCLTNDSSYASAIYVPFYAGLDVGRFLWGFNTSMRDSTSLDLVKWLEKRPEWKVLGGKDHFLVAGRITWDFRRLIDEPSKENDWGNKLMVLPEAKNMSMLVIESSPWHSNDFAIPYPTYFHPSTDSEVFQWQNKMRRIRRRHLFSFAGAPRPNLVDSIRNQIIDQCRASRRKCKLLECYSGVKKCDNPSNVMKLFQSSKFCLQPSGDSFTRRSTFDSMLAGCIPVFFHPGSAYVQYTWHLPQNYTKYSVFISENDVRKRKVSIQKKLLQIPKEEVKAMREEVIRLIPRLIYADPRSRLETLKDALDLAVEGVIRRANKAKREIRDGVNSDASYAEENNWKYNLLGTEGKHEWDPFFVKPKDANS